MSGLNLAEMPHSSRPGKPMIESLTVGQSFRSAPRNASQLPQEQDIRAPGHWLKVLVYPVPATDGDSDLRPILERLLHTSSLSGYQTSSQSLGKMMSPLQASMARSKFWVQPKLRSFTRILTANDACAANSLTISTLRSVDASSLTTSSSGSLALTQEALELLPDKALAIVNRHRNGNVDSFTQLLLSQRGQLSRPVLPQRSGIGCNRGTAGHGNVQAVLYDLDAHTV